LKSWLAAKAAPKKPAAMKAAAQRHSVPSSRRMPAHCFLRIVIISANQSASGPAVMPYAHDPAIADSHYQKGMAAAAPPGSAVGDR
jgi:hypothetical protein